MEFSDVMEEELGYSFHCDHRVHWNEVYSFGDNIHDHHDSVMFGGCKGDRSGRLQEIPQLIIIYEIWLQPTSRRFLRELDEAPGGNNLHYILHSVFTSLHR